MAIGPARITFEQNSAALSADARAELDKMAQAIVSGETGRMTLKAYTSTGGSTSETRRMSLARGLAVRSYLIDKGVPKEKIDLQALGNVGDAGPADRVDLLPGKS
ncbi:MAG: OmpA family protein [Rhodospirillales bacterium]|nr:MAG: OmpA family protein [Rhodospirillales bacterium]